MLLKLDLSCNNFRSIPEIMCTCLTSLRELSLESNRLTSIGDCISHLTALKLLNLSRNNLAALPEVVGDCLTILGELRLSHNLIETIPSNLRECHATLEMLDLEYNKLVCLPPVVLELTRIKELRLDGNTMQQLPLELGRLAFLHVLTAPATDLGNVPRDVVLAGGSAIIRYLCGLEECRSSGLLDLANMNLHVVPSAVRSLASSLTILKLDNNPLTRLPPWLGELQALTRISMRSTPVSRLPATLGAIVALHEVVLEDNINLISPPEEVVAAGGHAVLAYLRRSYSAVLHHQLDLSGFRLSSFPFAALSTPTTLTSLSLCNNALTLVPHQLASLSKLVLLSLSNNMISHLPDTVMASLPLLRSLSVQGNEITRLPPTLGALRCLEYLDFDAHICESPPRDVLVKSAQAVLQ
jgi:Leucine-rich repeat (LRR) protein